MDEFEFDWEVLEILTPGKEDNRRGALVKYTPLTEGLSELEIFVPVPWHKATDTAHARTIMEGKINAYAPTNVWINELNPPPPDKTDEIAAELNTDKPKGERREAKPDAKGSGNDDRVPESSGPEG